LFFVQFFLTISLQLKKISI